VIAAAVLTLTLGVTGLGYADPAPPQWEGTSFEPPGSGPRAEVPEDRYALAGGCYVIGAEGGYVTRSGDGFATSAAAPDDAEPFFFKATALGRYLIYGTAEDFVAASEGVLGQAAYGATRSTPGAIAGGVALEQTDASADTIARSPANRAAGRGDRVVAAPEPSDLADWELAPSGDTSFSLYLPETDQSLTVGADGVLDLVDGAEGSTFTFGLADGCATFPEIEVNVSGGVLGGTSSYQEVRGFLEAHLHMMAFEFIGGRVRCGRPWHRFGVAHALVDCPDHEGNGFGAVLEQVLSGQPGPHNTDGWPTFEGWPRPESLTHEQVYYKWLERAWRGGLRLFVNLLVDNNQLCKVYPYKRNSCNEMDGVRLQAQRIRELQDYIDAQSGGPGEGWFRVVEDPFEARSVINEGKLAVVLGIEVSVPLDCGITHAGTQDIPRCDSSMIDRGLDEVYDLGVRQMELVNKFDNAFSGVTGDGGTTGIVVNQGNFGETMSYWRMETCGDHPDDHEHAHDKQQLNFTDDAPFPDEHTGRDSIFGAVLSLTGRSGAAPVYPEGPHCNVLGLSELGEQMIAGMAERGIIFDPDHMSARARTQSLDFIEHELARINGQPYSGIVSSHSWADDSIYPRVYELGGVVTPHAGSSTGFAEKWRKHREWRDPRFYFGFGFGSDVNGFSAQGRPRGANVPNAVTYPFQGFGGVTIDRQESGTRTYDINADGVSHYGLYPDWIEDLRRLSGQEIVDDLTRGAEAYLQMWERAIGIAPDACRADVADLTDEGFRQVQRGMTAREVLLTLGQPNRRTTQEFTYCMAGQRTGTVRFASDGLVQVAHSSSRPFSLP